MTLESTPKLNRNHRRDVSFSVSSLFAQHSLPTFRDLPDFLFDYIQPIILLACIHYLLYIYFYCIYFSEILALTRYSSIRVEIKFTTTTTTSPNHKLEDVPLVLDSYIITREDLSRCKLREQTCLAREVLCHGSFSYEGESSLFSPCSIVHQ